MISPCFCRQGLFFKTKKMSELSSYIAELKNKHDHMHQIIGRILMDNQGAILTMIKLRLYNTGIDGDGNLIGYYHPWTIKEKKFKNQRSAFINLRDSGDWQAAMFVKLEGDNVMIDSSDWKTPKLIRNYGQAILGLTDQEERTIMDTIIEPRINKLLDSRQSLNLFES